MKHPKQRAERRAVRHNWIAYRRYVIDYVWRSQYWKPESGKLSKWNLNCGCKQCHAEKYFKYRRKRRRALDLEVILNIQSWEE